MSRALTNQNKPAVFSSNQKQNLTERAHAFPRLATVACFSASNSDWSIASVFTSPLFGQMLLPRTFLNRSSSVRTYYKRF